MDTLTFEVERKLPRPARLQAVVRVAQGDRYVGDILIDLRGRVWRHADTIPGDVVLKAHLARRRGEGFGQIVGLRDGRVYSWVVVGTTAEPAA
ncbi:MAG: hypothetical protein U0797_20970 [Gemmataceae bacterium]